MVSLVDNVNNDSNFFNNFCNSVLLHEIGHQFVLQVTNDDHVDKDELVVNHENTEACVMSYFANLVRTLD